MEIVFTPAAVKDLRKLPKADAAAIISKLELYAHSGAGDVRKLAGRPGFRLRHGDWRVIFEIVDAVLILRVAHRREAYR